MSDNKKPAMLSLAPRDELVFEGPFNRSVCRNLVIGNPSKNQSVAFKLKTTSPRVFFVRPNIGVLGPDEKVTVDIFMQPIAPEAGQKQHKFLIQAALASGEGVLDLQEFWKMQKPANIWDAKIKCELVPQKPSDERQAGGSASASPGSKLDGETEFDAEEVSEPMAKLLKQVSMLEDERSALKDEIDILHDQGMMGRPKQRGRNLFIFASCIFTIVVGIMGAYYGKHYL